MISSAKLLSILTCLLSWQRYTEGVNCPDPPDIPYTLRDSYSTAVGANIKYFCPAHWIFDSTWQRNGVNYTCLANGTWSPTKIPKCFPATCYPQCKNGGTCMCGRTNCRCNCVGTRTGADCSIATSKIARAADVALLYPMADPHWIAQPDKSTNPWVFDISPNAMHGEINGNVVIVAAPSIGGKKYSTFAFAASPPGYISVTYPYPNLTLLATGHGKEYGFLTYWKPGVDPVVGDYPIVGYYNPTPPAMVVSIESSKVNMYSYRNGASYQKQQASLPTAINGTGLNLVGWYYDSTSGGSTAVIAINNPSDLSTSLPGNFHTTSSGGFYIGYNPNDCATYACPTNSAVVGTLGSFGMWGPALTSTFGSTDAASHANFSTTAETGNNGMLQTNPDACPVPAVGGMSLPFQMTILDTSSITYFCLPGYIFDKSPNGARNLRQLALQCNTDYENWGILPKCIPNSDYCDPPCRFGGTCACSPACSCQCAPDRTGSDCSVPLSELNYVVSQGALALWLFNADFLIPDGNGGLLVKDMTGNGNHLKVGTGIKLDSGPYNSGFADNAFEFTAQRADSLLTLVDEAAASLTLPFDVPAGQQNAIYGSIKYNSPCASKYQPIIVWRTIAGGNRGAAFGIDESVGTGKITHYKSDGNPLVLPLNGGAFTTTAWKPLKIGYQGSGAAHTLFATDFGTVTFNATSTATSFETSNGLHIGYSDYPTEITSDLTIAGLMIVANANSSNDLSNNFYSLLQNANKYACSAPSVKPFGFVSATSPLIGEVVVYTCYAGYKVDGTTDTRRQFSKCIQNLNVKPPTISVSQPSPNCTMELILCLPSCQNGGTCNAGSPPSCSCPPDFGGVDCSLNRTILPRLANLVALWPLTDRQVDSAGNCIDLVSSTTYLIRDPSLAFAAGPAGGYNILEYSANTAGKLVSAAAPSIALTTAFTISGYIRVAKTTMSSFATPSAVFGYKNSSATMSPGFLVSAFGVGRMYYKSGSTGTNTQFNFAAPLGREVWRFITYIYDGVNMTAVLDASAYGTPTAINNPTFINGQFSVGSTEITGPPKIYFPGSIGCVSIYNVALSKSELSQLRLGCLQYFNSSDPNPQNITTTSTSPITSTTTSTATSTTTASTTTSTATGTTSTAAITTSTATPTATQTSTPVATTILATSSTTTGTTTATAITTTAATASTTPTTITTSIPTTSTPPPSTSTSTTKATSTTSSPTTSTTTSTTTTSTPTTTTLYTIPCYNAASVVNASISNIPNAAAQISFSHGTVLVYSCDYGHRYAEGIYDQSCTCMNGTWSLLNFNSCKPVQAEISYLSIISNISDSTLVKYVSSISQETVEASDLVTSLSSVTALVKQGVDAVELFSDTFARIAKGGDLMTSDQICNVTKTFAKAVSSVLFALTNSSVEAPASIAEVTIEDGDDLWKCVQEGNIVKTSSAPILTQDQTDLVYKKFVEMTKALTGFVSTALESGQEFLVNEKFFSTQIVKRQLSSLPGLTLSTALTSVTFPLGSELGSKPLLLEEAKMKSTDFVSVVLYGYINNVYDITQPFNMPTVSLAIFDAHQNRLTLNPKIAVTQIAKPLARKANIFAVQKVDAQCDVSILVCNIESNADKLGSFATFPVMTDAGPFVLIFPPIKFGFVVYISIGSTPTSSHYDWRFFVTASGIVTSKGSGDAVLNKFNSITGFRAIIPESSIKEAMEDMKSHKESLKLNVLTKKVFEGYSETEDLPPAACEMQHVYGYHLKLCNATKINNAQGASRNKRDASNDTDTGSTIELQPESTEASMVFKSNYLGDIGADLIIPPNTIAFSNVFANFTTLVADNWGVLAFMTSAAAAFFIGVVFAWIYDKRDIKEWAYLPLVDNGRQQQYQYLVSVNQHGTKNYNADVEVNLRLIADVDQTDWRCLKDGVRINFKKSHPENFIMNTYYSIGNIIKLQFKLIASSENIADQPVSTNNANQSAKRSMSVFIDSVLIVDVAQAQKYIFKVNQRLYTGESAQEYELACEDDVNDWGYLVKRHVRNNFSETHPWFSVINRPLPSDWTRVERLACLVAGLFLAMLVNCMFYGKEADSPRAGISVGNLFRISWFTIWTSLIGSVIVIPPTFIIGFIFNKVKRKSAMSREELTIFNLKVPVEATEDMDEKGSKNAKRKVFQLPFWCIGFAWALVATCAAVSCFFVVLFAWLSGGLLPNILNGNQFYREKTRNLNFSLMPNHELYLLGPIRLRQQRVSRAKCPVLDSPVPAIMDHYPNLLAISNSTICDEDYSSFGIGRTTERRIFNGSWFDAVKSSSIDLLDSNTSRTLKTSPWAYQDTDGIAYAGWEAAYITGGYYIDIPTTTLSSAQAVLAQLRSVRWLDNATSVLFVEFLVMNPQLNLFVPVKIVFEAMSSGGMTYHTRLYSLQLYQYFGAGSLLTIAVQAIWLIMNITHAVKIGISLKKHGRQYFQNGWNILECTTVTLSFVILCIYAARFPYILSAISAIRTDKKAFVSLDVLISWEDIMMSLFGIAFMMNLLLFLRYLTFNKQWAILVGTLSRGRSSILTFLAVFVFITTMFAGLGHLLLGYRDSHFSSIARAMLTLSYNVIGFNPNLLENAENSKIAILFYACYAAIVFIVGIQIFMAIINFAYSEVAMHPRKFTEWDTKLSDYIEKGFTNLLDFRKPKTGEKVVEEPKAVTVQTNEVIEAMNRLANLTDEMVAEGVGQHADDWFAAFVDHVMRTSKRRHSSIHSIEVYSIRQLAEATFDNDLLKAIKANENASLA